MFQRYFIYNGKTYPSGTIIKMRIQDQITKKEREENLIFSSVSGNNVYACREMVIKKYYCFSENDFCSAIIEVTDKIHPDYIAAESMRQLQIERYNRKPTLSEQMNIPSLGIAWIWYIIIMAVAIIFNDRVGIWLLASVIFFSYRKKKLREEGYKL